jgi:hypothetical protein
MFLILSCGKYLYWTLSLKEFNSEDMFLEIHEIIFKFVPTNLTFSYSFHFLLYEPTSCICFLYTVTCTPIARQRVSKQIPAKRDSW